MDKKITCPFCGHLGAHIYRHNTTFLNPKEKFYWQTAFGDIIILDKYQCGKCYTHFIINPETNTPIAIRRESLFHDEVMSADIILTCPYCGKQAIKHHIYFSIMWQLDEERCIQLETFKCNACETQFVTHPKNGYYVRLSDLTKKRIKLKTGYSTAHEYKTVYTD